MVFMLVGDSLKSEILSVHSKLSNLKQELKKQIVGQDDVIEAIVIGLLTQGHILLEGMPGLAKTLLAKSVASAIDINFSRVQFTPDLLPADITGTIIYNPKDAIFETKKGPIFTGILLADEINRASAKVQSALLQAMEEKSVTLGETTYPINLPFIVVATENPIDEQGTYELPQAQMDRFLMKVNVGYPSFDSEMSILEKHGSLIDSDKNKIQKVIHKDEILHFSQVLNHIHIESKLMSYIVKLVRNTRPNLEFKSDVSPYIQYGASPRASLNILKASKAKALLEGREFVITEDVHNVLKPILKHRVLPSFEAITENISIDAILNTVLEMTEAP